jgi:hypothetical protein
MIHRPTKDQAGPCIATNFRSVRYNLSLIDDLSADAIERTKGEGFEPAVVVETSRLSDSLPFRD